MGVSVKQEWVDEARGKERRRLEGARKRPAWPPGPEVSPGVPAGKAARA